MNIATSISADQPAGVSVVRDARGLESFRDSACAATLWDRAASPDAISWLAGLDADTLPCGRVVVLANAVGETAQHLCDIAGMPKGQQCDWLIDDIASLAQRFSDLMQSAYLQLRLEAVATNACRKFHLDAIMGRLVCTYRGTGTQYGTSVSGKEPEHIFTVPTGAPILLRGTRWPPKPEMGLLHRSPPIEGTGETRLVLVLDPIFDLETAE
ncbi:DUF1826 domain-containing protein (plasmid) [Rhodobacteraceae bacterium M382]|nr:DUF1826 domain-containing protein [Rhodobacteraceae bacterium M382]